MKYRRLGKTDLMVSEIGYGGHLRGPYFPNAEERVRQIGKALDSGVNFFDVTDYTVNPRKHFSYQNEAFWLGRALKKLKRRRECYISAMWWDRMSQLDERCSIVKFKESINERANMVLRDLHTDVIDVFRLIFEELLPISKESIRTEAAMEVLQKLKKSGKIRYIALTGDEMFQHTFTCEAIRRYNIYEAVWLCFNFFNRCASERIFPLVQRKDLGLVIMQPLAMGLISRLNPQDNLLKDLRRKKGETVVQSALRCILAHHEVSSVIPAMNTVKEVIENTEVSK